ncbi:uncharacterized protein LY79DRAFT_564633 [Colletotrichum navitas]|uniref:Secreted protein n=1 Tax=Colletotrichum navitas TaxID=681940 RepID=A0AAD8UZK1_9PEZI|nr:uncharacterized protein LY79DRAFT_564633 [Colletotrichum navitas]KAK1579350.1 hypothetical protein LY79DRAFT_564633 [Colletotrichum navitas]
MAMTEVAMTCIMLISLVEGRTKIFAVASIQSQDVQCLLFVAAKGPAGQGKAYKARTEAGPSFWVWPTSRTLCLAKRFRLF